MRREPLLSLMMLALGVGLVASNAEAENESRSMTTAPAAQETKATQQTDAAEAAEGSRRAIAVLEPTAGNNVTGTVTFEESPSGVRVQANVSGLPGGEHAYHVHVYGDCSASDATSAGPHYRFGPSDTGITGNLGELEGQQGRAQESTTLDKAKLSGARSIIGRSVVVHMKGNDPSQPPDGAAGARLACGVIGLDEAQGASSQASPTQGVAPDAQAPMR